MTESVITTDQVRALLAREEGHFLDYKSKEVSPAKLTKALNAFANADGGELMVGIRESSPGVFVWDGFNRIEDANGHIQHLEQSFLSVATSSTSFFVARKRRVPFFAYRF